MSPHDLLLLQTAHHIRSVDDLLRDLKRVGDTLERVEQHLGHPISEITSEEESELRAYLARAEEALRNGKPTPRMIPLSQRTPGKDRV